MHKNTLSKQHRLIFLLFAVLISPVLAFADADNIFRENNKAVVVVVAYNEKGEPISQGSGFIVRADGAIVTNYHVISNAKDIKVKAGDSVFDVEGLINTDKENDLVILKVKGEKLPTVKLGDITKVNIGEKVYVISSPEGLENTISDGILSGIREITSDRKVLQITAPISPGSSGGPVFNKDGEVIGIATLLIKEAQNLNFAMPVNFIKDKIESNKVTSFKGTKIEDYKKTAKYWVTLGDHYFESGLYKEAIEALKQAIRITPDDAEAHLILGIAYESLGMYKEEIKAFKQVVRIVPNYARAHLNIGVAYHKSGMYRDSIEAFKQAIKITPDDAEAHFNLGISYGSLHMDIEAMEAFKQAIINKPDYAKAHLFLGNSYLRLRDISSAMEAYKQAIRIKPDDASAHYFLGLMYSMLGDRNSALEEYKILKNIDTEQANELFNVIYK